MVRPDRLAMNDNIRAATGRPITGRMVLVAMIAFFGVVFAANLVLLRLATSTFGGLETESAYRAGLAYNREAEAAERQDARGWQVEATAALGAEGQAIVAVTARDRSGGALSDLDGRIRLARPADRRLDREARLTPIGAGGRYEAVLDDVPAGQWDLVIAFDRAQDRVFLSRSRIVLGQQR